jgi:hypothetical protein
LDDAAGVVAVQGGERTAQDFDALGHVQVEGGGLALAVRHGRRDTVSNQTYTAHTEGRAGAEAARGDLQVLRIVLAVLDHDARHGDQGLRQVHPRLASLDALGIDDAHGRRQVETLLLRA